MYIDIRTYVRTWVQAEPSSVMTLRLPRQMRDVFIRALLLHNYLSIPTSKLIFQFNLYIYQT